MTKKKPANSLPKKNMQDAYLSLHQSLKERVKRLERLLMAVIVKNKLKMP